MERKIREIFEYNGEWYQCLKSPDGSCKHCDMNSDSKCPIPIKECTGSGRTDKTYVIFKKLERVGEPVTEKGKAFQRLNALKTECTGCVFLNSERGCDKVHYIDGPCPNREIWVEINQNKEDMEEKKVIELLSEKVHNAWMKEKEAQGFSYGKEYDKEKKKHPDMLPYNELKEEVKEYDRTTVRAVLQAQKELQSKYNYNNLKPFDLEAAKSGKSVCTRDGRKARIICFDKQEELPIVALVETNVNGKISEEIALFYINGRSFSDDLDSKFDLMMLPEKKSGWVNVYRDSVYDTKDEAIDATYEGRDYIDTVKVSWEE